MTSLGQTTWAILAFVLVAACGGKVAEEGPGVGGAPPGDPSRGAGEDKPPSGHPTADPNVDAPFDPSNPYGGADPCHTKTAPKDGTSCLYFHLARPICTQKPILDGWYCTCDVKEGAGDPGAGPEKAIWVCEPYPFP